MNQSTPRPPILEILPESAPFTPEQYAAFVRRWKASSPLPGG
jgi:hypothetical protein